jgi:hypothetical protein
MIDRTGQKIGRWTVEHLVENSGSQKYWFCVCDCGNRGRVRGGALGAGRSLSCGCRKAENFGAQKLRLVHGMYKHPAFRSWCAAKARCMYPSQHCFKNYGGRGIKVDERWLNFTVFWAEMGPSWASGLSLDRIDVNGNYEPGNCRWATNLQQAANRRKPIKAKKGG